LSALAACSAVFAGACRSNPQEPLRPRSDEPGDTEGTTGSVLLYAGVRF
jgi:hypothetical protein